MEPAEVTLEEKAPDFVEPTDPIAELADVFFKDRTFHAQALEMIKEVTKDGKLTKADAPDLIILLMEMYNRRSDLHIEMNQIPDVFYLLLIRLLDEIEFFKDMPELKVMKLKRMIKNLLRLATASFATMIKVSKFNCFGCCR